MTGYSKPLIPIRTLFRSVRVTARTQWHLAALFSFYCFAGSLAVGISAYSFMKPEVGVWRNSRTKFGQYQSVDQSRPTNLLFQTKKMASVYSFDPSLAALHAEMYSGGEFDVYKVGVPAVVAVRKQQHPPASCSLGMDKFI